MSTSTNIARAIARESVIWLKKEHGRNVDEQTYRGYVYVLGLGDELELEVLKFMRGYLAAASISVYVDDFMVDDDGTYRQELEPETLGF